jgi:hypothetical protein
MYTNNEILFPYHVIPSLQNMRGPEWFHLVERVLSLPKTHEETLAFMLMMIRLNGCMGCETDSYRAMKGCMACAQQTLRRYKGTDADLMKRYNNALADVRKFGAKNMQFKIVQPETLPVNSGH